MARIWIVEDDPQIGLLIELTVKKAGHEARRLVDGVESDVSAEGYVFAAPRAAAGSPAQYG